MLSLLNLQTYIFIFTSRALAKLIDVNDKNIFLLTTATSTTKKAKPSRQAVSSLLHMDSKVTPWSIAYAAVLVTREPCMDVVRRAH